MASLFSENRRIRKDFSKITSPVEIPNLIELQRKSYDKFLQAETPPQKRDDIGLQAVFKSVFPIEDFNRTASLEFESYTLEKPKYDVGECRQRGMTFAAPLKITVRLVVYDVDEEAGTRNIRDIKEQEVYMGEIPLMTEAGSFIINGTERVIVSQLHRSPGVIFDHDQGKSHSSGKILYSARVIPHRGSWLDFEFDHKDILYARIDRKRKLPATIVLRAIGMSNEEILNFFYRIEKISFDKDDKFYKSVDLEILAGQRADEDIVDPKSGDTIVKKNRKFTKAVIKKIEDAGIKRLEIAKEFVIGRVASEDIVDQKTGEVLLECNQDLTESKITDLRTRGIKEVKVIFTDNLTYGAFVRDTLLMDKVSSPEEALIEVYKRMRPGDPPTIEAAKQLFENMFFNPDRYDLSKVGRLKLNYKFPENNIPSETTTLSKADILSTLYYLCELNNGRGTIDDIDHLGNRRVRAVGELIENQYRIGLVRMERAIKERMSIQEIETLMPHDLINQKPVSAVVKEFFGSSQLSQFMDQTNPLSEVTHKRRLSALGPGGLTRERAGFEVRDVHNTHYGRICPIETPEGPNIGLIASLSTYARVNEFGFIETPYRVVTGRKISDDIKFFTATEEENKIIAQVSHEALKTNKLGADFVSARRKGDFALVNPDDIELMDVSPNQLVSIAASLIPFLEHDDANRALMGSNMQRQAVPLIRTAAPLVGTGIERIVARDSGQIICSKYDGEVIMVDGTKIVVRRTNARAEEVGSDVDIYNLTKYQRSNQNTCVTQRPVVISGDRVKAGDVLADGPATDAGELALGQNVLIAFMPWSGYNFEDSILISERLIKDDTFTSIHIEEFECVARDTKLGKEDITRDIPNVGEEALKDLDTSGIIRIGAEVKPGDILVGKVTPKGETQLSPEEKLLRAIFGEKAGDVRDTSLRVPSGVQGIVINAQVFAREGTEPDDRTKSILEEQIAKIRRDEKIETDAIRQSAVNKIAKILEGANTTGKLLSEDGSEELLKKGQKIERDTLTAVPFDLLGFIPVKDELEQEVTTVMKTAKEKIEAVRYVFKEKTDKLKRGDELAPGVIKMVKVQIAIKRKLQVGDKMAGRHGNKGVISRILPAEDMPFMANGKPVDMVLNPLGVPSRMNIGQLLEVTLGWAAYGIGEKIDEYVETFKTDKLRKVLKDVYSSPEVDKYVEKANDAEIKRMTYHLRKGIHVATPVFDGANEKDIDTMLSLADFPSRGQTTLYDGVSGEPFAEDVTVGIMYMLKLHHLVEEKIHARSIGPYSLVTQQPLGGKAQFGGQRLGEMEVWALEAYGAAFGLQEFLTVKSDDVTGRNRMYEAIVKGEQLLEPGLPESFNVLVKELQSLALNVELIEEEEKDLKGELL
ncbi:MAG TPA: DNA-directed RNA polymerase subunit beta [Bdellovibrionales bacterium]|nr:MAG: DNA-directed RNA polymerase subunit beta [Bdellovibrionales bacterium GWB1_52_6]OFZ06167.1 MAG: DNA-directed RNA polymerase subunit beta [Bdellovibrionales bacterium GWA1_52_35]OFZ36371.1 MAG: DNA-directed RNA polymerase subunit beta [Bdellovibrionales bacterium GWC1_52_8]HAR41752.1 DNA-directed RNA polymerase subunit beta [Bdellovibrionales bacterium]HCM41193.1 DNA-directed RNA polymerase subunit beta [Bdellovibrionales bacterium]